MDSVVDLVAVTMVIFGFSIFIASFSYSIWHDVRFTKAELEIESLISSSDMMKNFVLSDGDGVLDIEKITYYSVNPEEIPLNVTYMEVEVSWNNESAVIKKGTEKPGGIEIEIPVIIRIDELAERVGKMRMRVIP